MALLASLSPLFLPKAKRNGPGWALRRTVSTANARTAVGCFRGIDIHRTDFCTLAAMDALFLVHIQMIETDIVEQPIDGPQGT